VRIKVNDDRHTVRGISSYSSESYDKKFKKAVLNATYTAYAENKAGKGRKKKLRYDDKFNYELVEKPKIAYLGKPVRYAKKGINRRLHNEIILQQEKKYKQSLKEKQKEKQLDKSISKKKAMEEIYGKRTKEGKMKSKDTVTISRKEYEALLKLKKKKK
jgi:hypothetical protein